MGLVAEITVEAIAGVDFSVIMVVVVGADVLIEGVGGVLGLGVGLVTEIIVEPVAGVDFSVIIVGVKLMTGVSDVIVGGVELMWGIPVEPVA